MTVYLGDGQDDPASGLVTSDLSMRPGSRQFVFFFFFVAAALSQSLLSGKDPNLNQPPFKKGHLLIVATGLIQPFMYYFAIFSWSPSWRHSCTFSLVSLSLFLFLYIFLSLCLSGCVVSGLLLEQTGWWEEVSEVDALVIFLFMDYILLSVCPFNSH